MDDYDDYDDYDYPASACVACDGYGHESLDDDDSGLECPYCEGTGVADDGYVSVDPGPLRVALAEAWRVR
jgi:hypothetical protein